MSDAIKYISKVEIKGLWGRYDIEWNLQPDVNVLSGINGSGKTTILNCVYGIISHLLLGNINIETVIGKYLNVAKISFNDDYFLIYQFFKTDYKETSRKLDYDFHQKIPDNFIHEEIHGRIFDVFIAENLSPHRINDFSLVDAISTFDIELKFSEAVNKLSDENVKTELDWEIYNLQKKYLKYKLNIAQKTIEAINKNDSNGELIKLQANQNRFLEIIDSLFEQTGKTVNRKENEISFLSGEKEISSYQLSSGEKQLLVILLTVLVQDNKNAILFMDEPEISLHFDWQKKLIGYIRELNPNVQIILATHSPAIIIEGWMDKVANVSDIIKLA